MFRKLINHKNRRGMTLIELAVASSIFLVCITITYSVWNAVSYNFRLIQSRVEVRQEVRNSLNAVVKDIMNTEFIFSDKTVNIDGIQFDVKAINEPTIDMILAVPENAVPGGKTYTIIGYYLEQDNDPVNPNAHNLMKYTKTGVVPQAPDIPATIRLQEINGGEKRKIASFIDPDKFRFVIKDNTQSVEILPWAAKKEIPNQPAAEQNIKIDLNVRNR